jgi:hypothetical protein
MCSKKIDNVIGFKCDRNCKRCREIIEAINRKFQEKLGIPLTSIYCLAELYLEIKEAEKERGLFDMEKEIFLKIVKQQLERFLKDE